jgi:hypothetical protein
MARGTEVLFWSCSRVLLPGAVNLTQPQPFFNTLYPWIVHDMALRSAIRKVGLMKTLWAGLDIRNAKNGAPPHYRILYLELRRRPTSREPARPQPRPPASAGTGEEQRSQPGCRSGSPATEPSGPVTKTKLDVGLPGPHPAHPSSPIDPGDERRPIPPPLAPLIAQLIGGPTRYRVWLWLWLFAVLT